MFNHGYPLKLTGGEVRIIKKNIKINIASLFFHWIQIWLHVLPLWTISQVGKGFDCKQIFVLVVLDDNDGNLRYLWRGIRYPVHSLLQWFIKRGWGKKRQSVLFYGCCEGGKKTASHENTWKDNAVVKKQSQQNEMSTQKHVLLPFLNELFPLIVRILKEDKVVLEKNAG